MSPDPQRLAADPGLSAFVTANAGSGKTKTLIDRVARLLLAGAQPETILCVTYTKAAAAEMQRRLFLLLGDWSVCDDISLREALAKLEGVTPDAYDHRGLSKARALFASALETPRRPEDPDHPRLLRKAAAALSAGGRRLARLPGDGRRGLGRHRRRRPQGGGPPRLERRGPGRRGLCTVFGGPRFRQFPVDVRIVRVRARPPGRQTRQAIWAATRRRYPQGYGWGW